MLRVRNVRSHYSPADEWAFCCNPDWRLCRNLQRVLESTAILPNGLNWKDPAGMRRSHGTRGLCGDAARLVVRD